MRERAPARRGDRIAAAGGGAADQAGQHVTRPRRAEPGSVAGRPGAAVGCVHHTERRHHDCRPPRHVGRRRGGGGLAVGGELFDFLTVRGQHGPPGERGTCRAGQARERGQRDRVDDDDRLGAGAERITRSSRATGGSSATMPGPTTTASASAIASARASSARRPPRSALSPITIASGTTAAAWPVGRGDDAQAAGADPERGEPGEDRGTGVVGEPPITSTVPRRNLSPSARRRHPERPQRVVVERDRRVDTERRQRSSTERRRSISGVRRERRAPR